MLNGLNCYPCSLFQNAISKIFLCNSINIPLNHHNADKRKYLHTDEQLKYCVI